MSGYIPDKFCKEKGCWNEVYRDDLCLMHYWPDLYQELTHDNYREQCEGREEDAKMDWSGYRKPWED